MYTPGQASDMLKIATSTLRKYSQLYSNHLSEYSKRQHRRYTDYDISVLRRICQLRNDGASLDEVDLKLGISAEAEPLPPESTLPPLTPETIGDIQSLRETINQIQLQLSQQFENLRSDISHQQEEFQHLKEELTRTREGLDQARDELNQLNEREPSAEGQKPSSSIDNLQIELTQFRAEIYRIKESQKRIEKRFEEAEERASSPWWKRPTKKT